jgi:hypothetical protein
MGTFRVDESGDMGDAVRRTFEKIRKMFLPKNIFTSKGSIVVSTGADTPVELVVGANTTVLTADSATATGLKWATVAGGGGGDMLAANNLSELTATAATARTNLGLGTAATTAASAYEVAGAAAAAQAAAIAASQPLDADLTAIAALATLTYGRSLLTGVDAATTRTTLGLGTAATTASTAYATAAQGTTADAALKPANNLSDVTLASTARTNLGLGTAATTASTAYATAAQGTTADAALKPANNLSDVSVVATARTNLGLGTAATTASTAYATSTQGTTADNAIPKATVTAKGTVVTGTAASTPSGLLVGANGTFLKADSTAATGLVWATIPGGGDLLAANNLSELTATAATARTNLGLGTAATTASTAYATAAQGTTADGAVPKSLYTAKGMMGVATAASTPSGLAVGANNTMLVADSVAATGVKWANIVDANITTGTITLARLASGTSAFHPVCNISGVPVYVAMSGDITQTNAGVTAIGAAKVTNAMLSTTAGAPGGAWQTVATTFTNITNITGTTRWRQVGKTVNFNITCTFSGAPVISATSPQVTIPVARQGFQDCLTVWYYKTSTNMSYQGGGPWWISTTSFRLLATTNGLAFGAPITGGTIVTATYPFTFANTDQIFISGTYEAA